MELDPRMKTATSPFRPAIVLGLTASLTLALGALPVTLSAQESGRTMATATGVQLTPDAPDEYVVKRGDTLWDISKVYLRDPWYWPEIWYVNPQVSNPHLIYPGDKLRLVYVDGKPRLQLAERGESVESGMGGKRLSPTVRREALSRAITSVPYEVIAGFAGRPTLLDKEQVKTAPYVVAMRDDHILAGAGSEVYARGLGSAALETRYSIIHVDGELRDPDNNDMLGYSGTYVGSGPIATTGETAKVVLADSSREALQGDKFFPESTDVNVDFVPHPAPTDLDAKIMAVRDTTVVGQYQIIALNRGSNSGLEAGHVVALNQRGDAVRDRYSKGGLSATAGTTFFSKKVQLPSERVGVAMIYKTYAKMSFALIMEATHEVRRGDLAQAP
jgi:LysM repeat protein